MHGKKNALTDTRRPSCSDRNPRNHSKRAQKRKQRWVVSPPLPMWSACLERTVRQRLCLPFKINFGIVVGGVDGNVPKPCTNGVDINACAQEMGGRGVSNRVWADALAQQRRARGAGLLSIAAQEPINAVASDSLP